MKKPKLLIIRAIRPSEGIFYNAFKRMDVKFVYFSQKTCPYPIKLDNLKLVNLLAKPKFFIDPFALTNKGCYTNRSLVEIENLEEHVKQADVINISDTFYCWNNQVAKLAEKYKKKLVTIVWETIPDHPSIYLPPYSLFIKNVVRNTNLFILRSRAAKNFTNSLNIPKDKIQIIYKGIDLDLFNPKNKTSYKKEELRILYVGSLVKSKGVGDLLKAFMNFNREFPKSKLLLAGEGPLTGTINDLSKKYPIKYFGKVSYDNLPKIYNQADVFCSPSKNITYLGIKLWEELFSYTLMEAQACGLPIISTYSGGIPEEIGKNNILLEQGDVLGLEKSFTQFINGQKKLSLLGKENRKRAEDLFDLKKQAKKTEDAILSII